jgi:ribosomal protein L11 methylase PrmA
VANVLAGPLRAWAAAQQRFPPELILSGVLTEEADSVAAAFVARGGIETQRSTRNEWTALRMRFPSG